MKRIWWAQIKAVVRLEMRKTFFAKRGLWIYVVAALPVLLFIAYAVASSSQQRHRAGMAGHGEIGRASLGKECHLTCRSRWSPYH